MTAPAPTAADRLLSVLAAFDHAHPALSLSDIGRRAGLSLTTAHRLVGALTRWGALERDEWGVYHVGLRLWEIAALAPRGLALRQVAWPYLEDLFEAVVFGAFMTGGFSPILQIGLGLTLAVLIDATVVRMLLVPATMALLGRRAWWAPGALRRAHARFGVREESPPRLRRIRRRAEAPAAVLPDGGGEDRRRGCARPVLS